MSKGKKYWNYRYPIERKPNNFKVVDGKNKIFSSKIDMIISIPMEFDMEWLCPSVISIIIVPYHINNYIIDEDILKEDLSNIFNTNGIYNINEDIHNANIEYKISHFKRDGGLFPFIKQILFKDKTKGEIWVKNYERKQKLLKLLEE